MSNIDEILSKIRELAPENLASSWDNVGLLIGSNQKIIKKILITLDADINTIDEAVQNGVDLIVTHHPVIMGGLKCITDDKYIKLIKNDICVYCAHTNLDSADGGVNDVLAEKIGLQNISNVELCDSLITRFGTVNNIKFGELIYNVKNSLNCKHVRYVGDKSKIVNKVIVLGGSGGGYMQEAHDLGAHVYITGDVKYHEAQLAHELGLCVIDAGHFETENIICNTLAQYVKKHFADVEVLTSNRKESYIKYE